MSVNMYYGVYVCICMDVRVCLTIYVYLVGMLNAQCSTVERQMQK